MKKTYRGSCHCGRVRFEVDADLSEGTGRCNCSYCAKLRNWSINVKPEDFRLLSDEAEAGDYQFGTMSGHHRFCRTCGVRPYGQGHVAEIGGEFRAVSIACLDGVTPEELASLPIRYFDGLDNNWWHPPKITSYL